MTASITYASAVAAPLPLPDICAIALDAYCGACHRGPDQPCGTDQPGGVHIARILNAAFTVYLAREDITYACTIAGSYAGHTVVAPGIGVLP